MPLRRRHAGFTLVEAMTALVVLGLAVAAMLSPIAIAVEQKVRTARQAVAVALAEEAIEECLSKTTWSIQDPIELGPSGNEPWRDQYDENADYHNVVETGGQFGTVRGVRLSASTFPNMTRRMWLQTFYLSGEYTGYTPDFMMLTVRVYDGDEEVVTLRRIITNVNHAWP